MLKITNHFSIPEKEIEFTAIRSQGSGGQNVNKVSTAVHLRFDIRGSSLPYLYKIKLLELSDQRITKEGVIIIKSQKSRSRESNKEEALLRLQELIKSVGVVKKKRRATKPSRRSMAKRMDQKTKRGMVKAGRGKIDH